jgi:hypothetical protein
LKLYKFLTDAVFSDYMDNYLRGNVYISAWNAFNDPMEGFFHYFLSDGHIADEIVGQKSRFRVSSFTPKYNNFLMWSHYTNKHKGVCLEYEVDPAALGVGNLLENITYVRSLRRIDTVAPIEDQAKIILLTKTYHWRYEKEVRLLFDSDRDRSVPFGQVKAVIFGTKSNDDLINDVKHQIRMLDLKPLLYKATINYNKAAIGRTRISVGR